MNPIKIIRKLTTEIIDQKTKNYDFIRLRIIWAFVAGWEKGISYKKGNTPVIKMDKYGKSLNVYESISEAAKKNQLHAQGINAVCKGRAYTHGGFHWKYVYDSKKIEKIIEGWQNEM